MQQGSVIREHRKLGPDVWCFRWWEAGPNGNRVHRRIVLGTAEQMRDASSARKTCLGKLYFVYLFCALLCSRENPALSVSHRE
jgi:hypothetical protein